MSGTLYLVGTPIGNLEDLTDRARRVLSEVDLVAAEDTRRTGRLLEKIGVRARLVSFFEGNEEARVGELMAALKGGSNVAVVVDAGMPGVSDPGYRIVVACLGAGIAVDVVPGPSAVIAALVVSGLPTDRFAFEGFLPRSGGSRRERLGSLAAEPRTIVLFESPRRLVRTLSDLLDATGDRRVAVARELTKLHQEVLRGRLSEVIEGIGHRTLKGEIVVVVEGAARTERGDAATETSAFELAADLVRGGAKKRQAARRAGELTGVPAGRIYKALVSLDYGAEAGSKSASPGRRADSSE
jgi:16S rRNA (cytidine1402-2'-O)-methyltransferase